MNTSRHSRGVYHTRVPGTQRISLRSGSKKLDRKSRIRQEKQEAGRVAFHEFDSKWRKPIKFYHNGFLQAAASSWPGQIASGYWKEPRYESQLSDSTENQLSGGNFRWQACPKDQC